MSVMLVRSGTPLGSGTAPTARVRLGRPWEVYNNVVTPTENRTRSAMSTTSAVDLVQPWRKSFGICKPPEVPDGDVHHLYEPAVTTAMQRSTTTSSKGASSAATRATDHRPSRPSTPSMRTMCGKSLSRTANPTERHGRLRANRPVSQMGSGFSGSSPWRSASSSTTQTTTKHASYQCVQHNTCMQQMPARPTRTSAEHRAIRFLSFSQDALATLQAMETRLQQQLCSEANANGARRADIEAQLKRVRREIELAVRGRHRAVAQLRAAEARAGRRHHDDCPRRALSTHGGAAGMLDFVRGASHSGSMLDFARGASHYALAARAVSHRGRAVRTYLRSAIATAPLSPSAERRRHRPREVQVRRHAIAMARSIAEAKGDGRWAAMQPRHQQLTLALLRWYEGGAPVDREPGAHVPIEEWLSSSPPSPSPPPPPSPLPPVTHPYGLRTTCALSVETLEDRYRQELERADRYPTVKERVRARRRADAWLVHAAGARAAASGSAVRGRVKSANSSFLYCREY